MREVIFICKTDVLSLAHFSRDSPDTTSYWPKTVALSVAEYDYGLGREIAWWSPGVVGRLGDWTVSVVREFETDGGLN